MWHSGDGMGWWMLFGSVWFVLFWAFVAWAVFRLVDRGSAGGRHEENAMEILRRRYASGEITKEQFDQMRDDLR